MGDQFLVFDVGCMECRESSSPVGLYRSREEAEEAALRAYDDPERIETWGGEHEINVYELPPLPLGRCSTCRHWSADRDWKDERWGDCALLSDADRDDTAGVWTQSYGYDECRVGFTCPASFGCTEWQPIDRSVLDEIVALSQDMGLYDEPPTEENP